MAIILIFRIYRSLTQKRGSDKLMFVGGCIWYWNPNIWNHAMFLRVNFYWSDTYLNLKKYYVLYKEMKKFKHIHKSELKICQNAF
jgi:hypothetical protein